MSNLNKCALSRAPIRLSPNAVWKAFGHVFGQSGLRLDVSCHSPLKIIPRGDAAFDAYAAGVASDRYVDQARLLIVGLIQEELSTWNDAKFQRRFPVMPSAGQTSKTDETLKRLLAIVKTDVRNFLQRTFAGHDGTVVAPDIFDGLQDTSPELTAQFLDAMRSLPSDELLRRAVKYVFGPSQMAWGLSGNGSNVVLRPCYKYEKARSDWRSPNEADWARSAVVRVVDHLLLQRAEEAFSVKSEPVSHEILRAEVEALLELGIADFWGIADGSLSLDDLDDQDFVRALHLEQDEMLKPIFTASAPAVELAS